MVSGILIALLSLGITIVPFFFGDVNKKLKWTIVMMGMILCFLSICDAINSYRRAKEIVLSELNVQLAFTKLLGTMQQHEIEKSELVSTFPRNVSGILYKGNGFTNSETIARVVFVCNSEDCIITQLYDALPKIRFSATLPYKMETIEYLPGTTYRIESLDDFRTQELLLKIEYAFDREWSASCPISIGNKVFYPTQYANGGFTINNQTETS